MNVYVLTCYYHDGDDWSNTVTVDVFDSLDKAKAKLKEEYDFQYEDSEQFESDFNDTYASITDLYDDYHWEWEILEKEIK